jgi:hypothetical protein
LDKFSSLVSRHRGANVFILRKYLLTSRIMVATALLCLTAHGSAQLTNSGNFSGTAAKRSDSATGTLTRGTGLANVTLGPARLKGGDSTEITVSLNQPAPEGGLDVQLKSSDTSVIAVPATVRIPSGETSATVVASTAAVNDATTVAISALYGDTVTGTSLMLAPETNSPFAIRVRPSSLTITQGHAKSTKVTTTVTGGYDHALQLSILNMPAGVSVTLTPAVIPAPGAGTSKAKITVSSSVAPGAYTMQVQASDGTNSATATLTLNVTASGPGATFQGCWYPKNGHRYQGVRISVANPGTYPFDAVLYRGATCNPNDWADEFGFGTPLNFGGFDWIFYFTDFADQTGTSALWYVGSDTSQCVNYAVAPDC